MRELYSKGYTFVDCQYAYYNDDTKDREYMHDIAKLQGYKDIKVYRCKTDTKGLKMYEIWGKK